MHFIFHDRVETSEHPAGTTVSRGKLPDGDFIITEYSWGSVSLWFVDVDCFTDDERELAYECFMQRMTSQ